MTFGNKDAAFAFAKHVVDVKYEDIPYEAIEVTKTDILDTLGVAIAASTTTPACRELAELAKEMGGKEESTIIAYGGKVPCYMAAFVNAALAHSLNYDNLYDAYAVHPGCVLLPSALAVAERVGKVSGKEFITAYTLGLDVMGRLGRAVFPPILFRDWVLYGWLPGQLFGYFGATAVAGRLLGLDEGKMVSAFGLAYCQTAGNCEPFFGGAVKGIYPSYPAKSGVLSALMAQRGIAGPRNSLEGNAGLFKVYFQGEYDSTSLTSDLGKHFKGVELGFYAFPCCGLVHPYVSSALQMVDEYKIQPQDVDAITVFVGPKGQHLCCEPLQIRRNPRNISEAQVSIPFSVATAIVKGKPRIGHFTSDGIRDPDILQVANRVTWQADPKYDKIYGTGVSPAKIEITLRDKRIVASEQKGFRYGHYQNPISKGELVEKFRDCTSYSEKPIPKDNVEKMITMVGNLEELEDVNQIIQLVS